MNLNCVSNLDWKADNSGHVRRLPRYFGWFACSSFSHVRKIYISDLFFQTLIKITYIDLWIEIHLKGTAVTLMYFMRTARIRCLKSLEFAQRNACTYHDKCTYEFHAFEVFFLYNIIYKQSLIHCLGFLCSLYLDLICMCLSNSRKFQRQMQIHSEWPWKKHKT